MQGLGKACLERQPPDQGAGPRGAREGGLGTVLFQGLLETELHPLPQASVRELKFYGSASISV